MYSQGTEGPEQRSWASKQRRGAAQRFRHADLPLVKLWTYYYGIGGEIDEVSLDAYLNEALDIPPAQMSLVTLAMTELAEGDPL
jgi:hypothetical protein